MLVFIGLAIEVPDQMTLNCNAVKGQDSWFSCLSTTQGKTLKRKLPIIYATEKRKKKPLCGGMLRAKFSIVSYPCNLFAGAPFIGNRVVQIDGNHH